MNYNAKPFHYIKEYPKYNETKNYKNSFRYKSTRVKYNNIMMMNIDAKPYKRDEKQIYTIPQTGQQVTFLPTTRNLPTGYKSNDIEKTIRFVKNLKET